MMQSASPKYSSSIPEQAHSSDEQEIVVKNIDTGETHSGTELTNRVTSVSAGNSAWQNYFNSRTKLGEKLLQLVTRQEHKSLQGLLIQFPIDLSSLRYMSGWTLLHFAISKNDLVCADLLLRFGLDVNSQTEEMLRSGLHEAALGNRIELVELLVGWGADPNLADLDRNTSMHFAVDYGYLEVVKALLSSSIPVDLNVRNNTNMTPFNTCRNPQIFQILITYCSKVTKSLSTHSKQTAESSHKSCQPTRNTYESRLIVRNSDVIPKTSRTDQVQKFLSLRQNPIEKKASGNSNNTDNGTVISEESYEESLVDDAPQPELPLRNGKGKGSIKRIGAGLRSSKLKNSFRIASQNIGLMRESIFKTHLQNQQVIDNYDILKKLGNGAFGQVYLVRRKRSSNLFALKEMDKARIAEEGLRRYVDAQRYVLTQISHPFLLHASFCLQDFTHLYILTQYCVGGDLEKIVRTAPLSENIARTYICEAAMGVQALHDGGILYRDLKVSNTLIDAQGHLKLADFGLAKRAVTSGSFLGSVGYLAPQMLQQGSEYGQALDWYLLGIFAYELMHGQPPFYCEERAEMERRVREEPPVLSQNLSKECKEFIGLLLQKDQKKRLVGLQGIKGTEWLKGVDWVGIAEKKGEVVRQQMPLGKSQFRKQYFQDDWNDKLIDDKIEWYDNWNYPPRAQ